MIPSSKHHYVSRFQPPNYKVTCHTNPNAPNDDSVHLSFQTFPSCSRNPALFGCVESKFREAWQRVSTISRSKFRKHKPSPILSQTIWLDRGDLGDLKSEKNKWIDKVPAELSRKRVSGRVWSVDCAYWSDSLHRRKSEVDCLWSLIVSPCIGKGFF